MTATVEISTVITLAVLLQGCLGVPWDSACGSTKGCFPNCEARGCSYLVTWASTGSAVTFELFADESGTDKWLALAFSNDYRMGDDSVVACIPAAPSVTNYYNDGTDSDELSNPTLGLSSTSVSLSGGVLTCTFTRTNSESSDSRYFDITNKWIIQLGIGEVELEDGSYLLEHHYMIPYSSASKVNFQSTDIVDVKKLNGPLVKLHAAMMMLAWIIFSSVGIITARYNKDLFGDKKLFGTKPWFQVHRTCMVITLAFVVVGFIPIFVEIEGYSQITPPESESFVVSHPILGIVVTVLTFINPIMALFRPGPDHKFRFIFNWAHMGVGMVTQLLAVITIFFGYVLERSGLPDNTAIYLTIVYVIIVIAVVIVMEIFKIKQNRTDKAKVNDHEMTDTKAEEAIKPIEVKESSAFPMFVLFLFALAVFALALGLLAIIAGS